MKKRSMIFSIFAFVLAATAALATTSADYSMTTVWKKSDATGACSTTACALTGNDDCGGPGYTYFNNPTCGGSPINPRRN